MGTPADYITNQDLANDGWVPYGYKGTSYTIYYKDGQYKYVTSDGAFDISPAEAYGHQANDDNYTRMVDIRDPAGANGDSGGSASANTNVNITEYGADAWENFPGKEAIEKYLNWYYPYVRKLQEQGYPEFPFDLEIKAPEGEAAVLQQAKEMAQQGMFGPGGEKAIIDKIKADYEENTTKRLQETLNARNITGSAGIELMAKVQGEQDINIGAAEAQLKGQNFGAKQAALGNYYNMMARPEDREKANLALKYQDWATRNMYPAQTAQALGVPTAQIGTQAMTSVYNTGVGAGAGIAQSQIGASAQIAAAQMGIAQEQWSFGMMEPYLAKSMEQPSTPGKK